jgi:hypothetical protein
MTGTATIQLMDDWVNTGTVNENSSLVVFNGPVGYIQDITSGAESFNDITFNSDNYIRLQDEVLVNGGVIFTDGLVKPSASEILSLGAAATVSGASDQSHCTGSVAKTTEATSWFTFPVGDGIYYRAIGVSPSSTSSTVFTATYNLGQAYTSIWVDDNNGTIDHASNVEYWDLDRSGAANATIELSWNGRSDVDNLADLLVGHWDPTLNTGSGAWESAGNTVTTGAAGSGTIRSEVNWSSYSPIALASGTSNNILPVELVSFNAFCQNNVVGIDWITSSELLNDYFLLEKSIDGITYDPLTMLDGAGTSAEINTYSYTDPKGLDLAYYRLTQVDFDGTEKKSEVISTVCKADNFGITNITTNSNDGIFSIEFLAKEAYELSVYDMRGRKVLTFSGESSDNLELVETLNLSALNSGIYQVVLVSNGNFSTDKILR